MLASSPSVTMSTTKAVSSSSTTTTTSPSHSTFIFPRPHSPTKESLRPNAHPYPIKTTSTALLSRSNSSASPHHQHHYVPTPPPPATNGGSPKRHGHGNAHRHRYSSSLSSEHLPRPLPIPPSPSDGDPGTIVLDSPERKRGKRSDTLPSSYSPGAPVPTPPLTLEDLDLPSNPKLWTPSQLSTYLATALHVKNGETMQLPAALTRDIAGFVRESKISGKAFLRLDEADLEGYGVNKLWRAALLTASRNLRQNILQGQLWGSGSPPTADVSYFSTPPKGSNEDDDVTPHRRRRSNSHPDSISKARQSRFLQHGGSTKNSASNGLLGYSSASSSASSSLDNLFTSSHRTISPLTASAGSRLSPKTRGEKTTYGHGGRYRNGRVKGMVDTFERSASFDEDDMEEGELKGTRKLLRELKGMREGEVEEVRRVRRERSQSQSGSESGASSLSSGGREGSPVEVEDLGEMLNKALKETEVFVEEPIDEADGDEPKYDISTVTPVHTGSSTSSSRPLPVPPLHPSLRSSPPLSFGEDKGEVKIEGGEGEEPTIEQLLAIQAQKDSLAHPDRHSLTRAQAAKLAALAHPHSLSRTAKSISKGTGRAKRRGVGVYAWEDEEVGEGEGVGKVTVKRVPVLDNVTEVVAPVPMVGGVKEIFKGEGEGETKSEGTSRTGTPSSRPLPTPPVHPSLKTFAEAEAEAEPEPEEVKPEEGAAEEESEQEKSLRASIEHSTALLENFKARLGEVERKVEVLEGEVEELVEDKLRREKEAKEIQVPPAPSPAPVWQWPVPVIQKILNGVFRDPSSDVSTSTSSSGSAVDRPRQSTPRNRLLSFFDPDPQKISQLPPYVILVGLGVCVVVLRVVAKRLGGRR